MKKEYFNKPLIEWYHSCKRDLPWRHTQDPYAIWLSEIILQQTRVDQGLPYYNKFIKRFPNVKELAEAEEKEVLSLWEGLGYYNRCRNFHRAAKTVLKDYNGEIPCEFNLFRTLPGVGDYTASAVLSIGFGVPLPAIDGNIKRVMARVLRIKTLTKYNYRRIKI